MKIQGEGLRPPLTPAADAHERWVLIMLSGERALRRREWVEGKRLVITQQSALLTISIFWNVTEDGELLRRGTCEISGWMKNLYRYRKGARPWKGLRR